MFTVNYITVFLVENAVMKLFN